MGSIMGGAIAQRSVVGEGGQRERGELVQWESQKSQRGGGCRGRSLLHLAPSLSRFEAAHSIDASLTSLMEGTIPHQNEVEERLQLSQVEL